MWRLRRAGKCWNLVGDAILRLSRELGRAGGVSRVRDRTCGSIDRARGSGGGPPVCLRCPVRVECAGYAVELVDRGLPIEGTWAGVTVKSWQQRAGVAQLRTVAHR